MKSAICKNCLGFFPALRKGQIFCCRECRNGYAYRKAKRKKMEQEQAELAEIMKPWHEKQEQGLRVSVCLYCLRFQWVKEPSDFCSRGCEILFNGH